MRRSLSILPLLWLTAGCGGAGGPRPDAQIAAASPPAPAPSLPAGTWRAVATVQDRARLRNWRTALVAALAQAGKSAGPRIAAEGVLLQPDRALPGPVPPAGAYRCRVIKLGSRASGMLDYVAYPAFRCRISAAGPDGRLAFAKLDGSQRPVGTLYPQDEERMIFLGTMVLGDERRPLAYGSDPERDMAGAVERIGPRRWRLLLPSPRWESLFDVMELVPG